MLESRTILSERLRRQRLIDPARTRRQYRALFALLQPVAPFHFSYPGSPPSLIHRTRLDEAVEADRLRARREIMKGRFLGGNVGYVLAREIGCYARAFRRPIKRMNASQEAVLRAVDVLGDATPRQLKEETGLLIKELMPALNRLQEAFLVFEDQVETAWDRGWYAFAREWPEVDLEEESWEDSAAKVLRRFLHGHVFATLEQMKDWSRWPSRALAALVSAMERAGSIVPEEVRGVGPGWRCAEDAQLKSDTTGSSAFMLHKSDVLVRSHATELKRRFGEAEVLQYLLIDGEFKGAVLGHWRIGPHDVEDVAVELPAAARRRRRQEILEAVARQYAPPEHRIQRFAGSALRI